MKANLISFSSHCRSDILIDESDSIERTSKGKGKVGAQFNYNWMSREDDKREIIY